MSQLAALILAIIEAIPILDKYYQQIMLLYVQKKKEKHDEAFLDALHKASGGSTTDLQREFGSLLD